MKTPLLLILLASSILLFRSSAKAQTEETDSLIQVLKKSPEDTNKVHLYWKVGASIIYQDAKTAIPYFKDGYALAAKLNFIPGMEKCQNATSLAFSFNAEYDSALVYINYAVPLAIKAGNIKRISLAYINRADVHNNLENYKAALNDCDSAIKYAEQINNRDGIARIYSIIGGIYKTQKQYDIALQYMDKSEKLFAAVNKIQMVALMYTEKAELYSAINRADLAVPLFKQAIHIADSLQDIENLSAYHNGLAEAYFLLKQYHEAEASSVRALIYSEQTGNERQSAVVNEGFSSIYREMGNIPKAIEYGLKAYNVFKKLNDLSRQQTAAAALAEAYQKAGNLTEAYKYLRTSHDLTDSIAKENYNKETARLQTSFDVTQKNKEIELLSKDKELQKQRLQKQRLLMLGALLLAILAVGGIWLLMNRNKLRQRMKELELRNQIAADLHDEVGSSLSSIRMLSQLATKKYSDDPNQQDILNRMSTNAKETMEKMGDIVWMIKPGESEGISLKQRMERFAYEMGSGANMRMQVKLEPLEQMKLTMEQRKNIYLIFKEAVNNAVKYSGAESVEVDVREQNKQVVLTITDDGRGFDTSTVVAGNGLENMRTRASELHGTLNVDSVPEKGTTITFTAPV